MVITGQLATSNEQLTSYGLEKPARKPIVLRLDTNKSREGYVLRTRIFIATRLLRLSARLARFALWIAPELKK